MRRQSFRLLTGMVLTILTAFSSQAATQSPREVVETAATAMTERLVSDRDKVQSQEYYLEHLVNELLLPVVDHKYMAKRVLAKNWKKTSTEQKKQFINAFKHKVIRTYAGAFKAFNGEKLIFEDARFNKSGKKASVASKIQRVGAPAINVTYKLFFKNDKWFTYDVVIEGVSLVKSFRDQFGQRIKKEGLAQAISGLAQEYKSEAPRLKMAGHAWENYISNQLPANGLAVDLVTAVLARAGYKVDMEFMPWKRVSQGLESGEVDISVASWFSESRAREVEYSAPYLENQLVILKRKQDALTFKDTTTFKNYVSKKGYRMAIFQDYGYGEEFDTIAPLVHLNYYKYCSQMVRDVASKKTDIALLDHWIAENKMINTKNIADHLEIMKPSLITHPLHITISRNNPNHKEIAQAFNNALKAMKKDGSYIELLDRHNYPHSL